MNLLDLWIKDRLVPYKASKLNENITSNELRELAELATGNKINKNDFERTMMIKGFKSEKINGQTYYKLKKNVTDVIVKAKLSSPLGENVKTTPTKSKTVSKVETAPKATVKTEEKIINSQKTSISAPQNVYNTSMYDIQNKGDVKVKTREWLIEKRKEANLSQAKLSKLSGVSLVTIQSIEQDKRYGSEDTWDKLIQALGVKFYDFKEILEYYGLDKFSIYMSYGLSISSYMRDLSGADFESRNDDYVCATSSYAFTINSKKMKFIKNGDEFTYDDQSVYIKISK
jgi:transcriptional regulator with XRE-family HTH domain